jgi:hypothetical protein
MLMLFTPSVAIREKESRLAEEHLSMLEHHRFYNYTYIQLAYTSLGSLYILTSFSGEYLMHRQEKEDEAEEAARKQMVSKDTKMKIRRADKFRQFQLLARCGWSPWVRLVEDRW